MASGKFAYVEQFQPQMDLAPFEGRPRVYLIASTPRSGSHFLGHGLMGEDGFGVPLEYLNKSNLKGWQARFGSDKTVAELLSHIIRLRTSRSGWFGLKAHWEQFGPYSKGDQIEPLLPMSRHIFIYRRNLLKQAISFLKARQTGVWISGAPQRGRARYDYDRIVRCARQIRKQNRAWMAYLDPACSTVIAYEDLAADNAAQLRRISTFIDPAIPLREPVRERTERQSDTTSDEWRMRFLEEAGEELGWITSPQEFHLSGAS